MILSIGFLKSHKPDLKILITESNFMKKDTNIPHKKNEIFNKKIRNYGHLKKSENFIILLFSNFKIKIIPFSVSWAFLVLLFPQNIFRHFQSF